MCDTFVRNDTRHCEQIRIDEMRNFSLFVVLYSSHFLYIGVQDLTTMVQTLLGQMQDKFQGMSDKIVGRIDDMGSRIDDLEKALNDLMAQAGVEDEAAAQ